MKGGNGRTDELTFEQPEEIAQAKVKPDGAAVIRNLSGRNFCANESGTAGEFISRLSKKFERRDFFIICLPCPTVGNVVPDVPKNGPLRTAVPTEKQEA